MTLSPLYRVLAVLALLATLVGGGLWYRASLISDGREAGLAEAAATAQEARLLASRAAALASEQSAARHAAALASQKAQHDRIVRDLSLALADSDHRNQRLSGRIASLLDEAAGLRAGLAAAAGPPGPAPDPAEADSTVEALIQTAAENYGICRKNATTLEELQAWYRDLRAQRAGPAAAEAGR